MKIFMNLILCFLALGATVALAEVSITGDVAPGESGWILPGNGWSGIGNDGLDGTLWVDGGTDVYSTVTMLGMQSGLTGTATITGSGTTWTSSYTNSYFFAVGHQGIGYLNILEGATMTAPLMQLGKNSGTKGYVTISGAGSNLTTDGSFCVGDNGEGSLEILNGGSLTSGSNGGDSVLGYHDSASGAASVSGDGSTWNVESNFQVGGWGGASGALSIIDSGLVAVEGSCYVLDNGSINMSTYGMLALNGDYSTDLTTFLGSIIGSGEVNYLSAPNTWSPLVGADPATDYTLKYITDGGDLDGYTLLTVGPQAVPEPSSVAMLLAAFFTLGFFRKFKK